VDHRQQEPELGGREVGGGEQEQDRGPAQGPAGRGLARGARGHGEALLDGAGALGGPCLRRRGRRDLCHARFPSAARGIQVTRVAGG